MIVTERPARAHPIDRENVADSVDDCDGRIDAACLRFGDGLRDDLLHVVIVRLVVEPPQLPLHPPVLSVPSVRGNGIAAGARGDNRGRRAQQHVNALFFIISAPRQ